MVAALVVAMLVRLAAYAPDHQCELLVHLADDSILLTLRSCPPTSSWRPKVVGPIERTSAVAARLGPKAEYSATQAEKQRVAVALPQAVAALAIWRLLHMNGLCESGSLQSFVLRDAKRFEAASADPQCVLHISFGKYSNLLTLRACRSKYSWCPTVVGTVPMQASSAVVEKLGAKAEKHRVSGALSQPLVALAIWR